MIESPDDLPAAARAQIACADADAELAYIAAKAPGPQVLSMGAPGLGSFRGPPAARDPVHVVLVVFETEVRVLCEQTWSADRLRVTADRLLDQRITRTFVQ